MCGILVSISGTHNHHYEHAMELLQHRGPDARDVWKSHDGSVVLGHQRLAIVGVSESGNQPIRNERGDCTLVCNGEIYNYPSLRKQLEAKGHHFASESDNEAVL